MTYTSLMSCLEYNEPLITLIMTLVTLGVLVIAILALRKAEKSIHIANQSLREAEKTRRDTFLPIIILIQNPMRSEFSPNKSSSITPELKNCGHGYAFRVKIALSGVKKIPKIVPIMSNMGQIESFPIGLLDTELQTKFLSKAELMIEYKDVFKRTVKTIYEVKQEKYKDDQGNEFYEPVIDATNYEVKLPD